jgi:hypothetical protein
MLRLHLRLHLLLLALAAFPGLVLPLLFQPPLLRLLVLFKPHLAVLRAPRPSPKWRPVRPARASTRARASAQRPARTSARAISSSACMVAAAAAAAAAAASAPPSAAPGARRADDSGV